MAGHVADIGVRLAHADSSAHGRHGEAGRSHRPRGAGGRRACAPRPPAPSAPAIGSARRIPTSGEPASSATATASSTPARSAGSPARRRCSSSPTTTSAPASRTRSRSPRSRRPIARALGLNVALTEAIALGHDCGHGPGGHASEDALTPYVEGGFDHALWGADVTLRPLNLCAETLDGIRNHSWSRPAPATPEGEVVSLGGPHRLRLPRLRGRGRGRHRQRRDAARRRPRPLRQSVGPSSSARSSTR